jgi:hypothetical protein
MTRGGEEEQNRATAIAYLRRTLDIIQDTNCSKGNCPLFACNGRVIGGFYGEEC